MKTFATIPDLTWREKELVMWLARGVHTKQIAVKMGLAHQTILFYLCRLKRHGLNRTELTVLGGRMLEAMAS